MSDPLHLALWTCEALVAVLAFYAGRWSRGWRPGWWLSTIGAPFACMRCGGRVLVRDRFQWCPSCTPRAYEDWRDSWRGVH